MSLVDVRGAGLVRRIRSEQLLDPAGFGALVNEARRFKEAEVESARAT